MTTPSHPRPDRRRDVTPDDRAHDEAAHEFWGDKADWSTPQSGAAGHADTRRDSSSSSQVGSSLGVKVARWWGSLSGTHGTSSRAHSVDPQQLTRVAAEVDTHDGWPDELDDASDGGVVDQWDERWETTSAPAPAPRSGVDPLLARFGGLAVIVTLLVPAFLGFASDSEATETVRSEAAPLQIPAPAADADGNTDPTDSADQPTTAAPAVVDPAIAAARGGTIGDTTAEPGTTVSMESTEPTAVPTGDDVEDQALTAPSCPLDYEVVAGDFWIRLADESGTSLADLLELNNATLDTALFPGRSICLPAGADTPAPPAPAATTSGPRTATVTRSATGRATSSRPNSTHTPAPTKPVSSPNATPSPPPPTPASPAEVQAIIRAVWPDELENRAIEIAHRESKFSPTAKNSCCYGVFQIYWSVHKSWLAGLGITSAEQLYDPTLNARAALALYQRAGSWGPWGG
jgi:hypothetical protein